MPRRKTVRLTPLELEIMKVLWETSPANVQTVQKQLGRELAYTTVQTMLNVLLRKGNVTRRLREKAYFYQPTVTRSEVVGKTIGDLIDSMFGGSAESLVMGLLETRHLTPEKLSRLNRIMEKESRDDPDQ